MTYIIRRRKLGKTSCEAIAKFSKLGIRVFRNDKLKATDVADDDLCIRWGCTSDVPTRKVLNKAAAIHGVSDKAGFREVLDEQELCPMTITKASYRGNTDEMSYPLIVRPGTHHQGRNLHVCKDHVEFIAAAAKYENWYVSEFIPKVAEYRVFIVCGRAVCVAKKTPADAAAVAWNVAQGGRFDNVRWDEWPLKAVKNSIKAFHLSGLDFGGVDVMVDAAGETYVLEINSAPSLTSEYRQQCFAKAFDYTIVNGRDSLPLKDEKGGYKKFIHPAVCDTAELVVV